MGSAALFHKQLATAVNQVQQQQSALVLLQMFVISEALEISAQRCLETPLPTERDLQDYGQLLTACLPSSALYEQVQALLTCIQHLGKAIAAFSSKKGVKAQAQQAISAAISCLKEPQGQPETTSSAPSVNSEIQDLAANQAHDLEQLAKKIGDPSTWRHVCDSYIGQMLSCVLICTCLLCASICHYSNFFVDAVQLMVSKVPAGQVRLELSACLSHDCCSIVLLVSWLWRLTMVASSSVRGKNTRSSN